MGNEIPRTEAIKTDDDNGTKGGVEDTTDDRGDDRDRYGANKYLAEMKNGRQSLQKPSKVKQGVVPRLHSSRYPILSTRCL